MMRKKRKIGLLDAFIGMIILLGAVGMILRARILDTVNEESTAALVYGVVQNFPADAADCIAVGETLYLADGTPWGVVEQTSASPAPIRLISEGATVVGMHEAGTWVVLTVVLRVEGSAVEDGFLRDGRYAVLRGETVTLYGARAELKLLVNRVEFP